MGVPKQKVPSGAGQRANRCQGCCRDLTRQENTGLGPAFGGKGNYLREALGVFFALKGESMVSANCTMGCEQYLAGAPRLRATLPITL